MLEITMTNRRTIDPLCGTHIERAAVQLVAAHPARMVFNGIELESAEGTTPGDIVAEFNQRCEEERATFLASPEGKRRALEDAERIRVGSEAVDRLMAELPTLDFASLDACIRWIERIMDPLDHVGVEKPRALILAAFKARGYEPGVNCGADFDGGDRDNFGRWVIGQALDGIEGHGVPHPMIHDFAEQWRERFGVE